MKVLITGGYGFIGSHVADRFHKEGHEVFIIDNLSSGKKSNIAFKHKGYILSVEDERCEEIFRANKFDIVVHLAAQVSVAASVVNPANDTETNVLGLVNMLNLSRKYRVSKFIFASSAAVYGTKTYMPIEEEDECSPISPYGISKWTGELYCNKWREMYGLQTVGFRFSNVYGPRQDSQGEGGVISVFIQRMLDEQPLLVHGDGKQTRDFIYVEDVADAIYRSSYTDMTGVYNLSTTTECSINEVVDTLKQLHEIKNVIHGEKRSGDIERSALNNAKVKRALDWSPMYSLREGLERTWSYMQQERANAETAASAATKTARLTPFAKSVKKLLPYGENLLAFALTAWLTLSQEQRAYGFIDVNLFYITIMGILYGNRQSIIAVMLSVGLFVYQKLLDGRELISLLYDTDFFFHISIYLFIGLVVGYAIERKNAQIHNQEQKIAELNGRYEFLNAVYNEVREVKEELQLRILNTGDSFGKIYSVTKELESLEPERILTSTVNVVKSIMNAPTVSIYTLSRNQAYLRLVAHSGNEGAQAAKSLKADEHAYVAAVLKEGRMFVNKPLSPSAPLMCAPIFYKDRIEAVVMVDGISFEKFSLYHQNLFKVTADLVSSALNKAFSFIEMTENQRYIEGTSLLRPEVFQSILESKKLAKEKHNTPYLLLRGEVQNGEIEETANRITGMLRETDYISLDEENRLLVLLSNTTIEDAVRVTERFAGRGLPLSTVE